MLWFLLWGNNIIGTVFQRSFGLTKMNIEIHTNYNLITFLTVLFKWIIIKNL